MMYLLVLIYEKKHATVSRKCTREGDEEKWF